MMLYRIARGGYSGGDPDLAINRGQMRVDGAGTDDQALSHLLIGQSLCHDAPLDVLSGGRAWLGIGAGDYEEEAVGSGLPFPPLKDATSGWRRCSRSACACGRESRETGGATRGNTTASNAC